MSGTDVEGGVPVSAVLAVDDVRANLLALSAILEPLHQRLVTATSGREALDLAARDTFAVILLDVKMPDLDGFETLTRLRAIPKARHTPVILLTSYELDAQAVGRLQGMGLVDYVLKPISTELLRSKAAALVALHLRGEELRQRDEALAVRSEEVRQRDEALAARDRGIAILAHDLQNPLAAIAMSAGRLVRADLDPRSRETAQRISRGAARMTDMVRNLTEYARAGRGSIPIAPAAMDLGDLGRELVADFQQGEPERRIDLSCAGNLVGEWDRTRLSQVISNLLRNALRYGSGDIAVRTRDQGADVELAVHNEGTPIPAERLPVIFKPFERGEQTGPGLGLGLYVVREIVNAHGGEVSVSSAADQGTTFVLRLPRRR